MAKNREYNEKFEKNWKDLGLFNKMKRRYSTLQEIENEEDAKQPNRKLATYIASFGIGAVAAIGISLSGMTVISRTVNFFDVSTLLNLESMDLSLLFAMGSALLPNLIGYRYLRGSKPLMFRDYSLIPMPRNLDRNLIIGSLLFGLGWAMCGYCPGPSIIVAVLGQKAAIISTATMCIGWVTRYAIRDNYTNLTKFIPLAAVLGLLYLLYMSGDSTENSKESPINYYKSALGGTLIGTGVFLYLRFFGRVMGLGGIFGSSVAASGVDYRYKIPFVVGFLAACGYLRSAHPEIGATNTTINSLASVGIGGFLVGFGTALSNGCTSGHGVAGNSRLSKRSLVATLCFFSSTMLFTSIFSQLGLYQVNAPKIQQI